MNWEHEVAQSADGRCIVDGKIQKGRSRFAFLPFSFFPRPSYLNYLLSRDYSFLLLSILIDRVSHWGRGGLFGGGVTCHSIVKCTHAARAIIVSRTLPCNLQ